MTPRAPRPQANPTRANAEDSAFGPLRRFFYRQERKFIVAWLMLLLVLNLLPVAWRLLDDHHALEARIIAERETRWAGPLRGAEKLARKGQIDEAIERFEQVLSQMPRLQIPERTGRQRLEATTRLASLYLESGEPKAARRLAKEVVASDPLDYRAHTTYANALSELGKGDDAASHYERSLEMHPHQLDVVKRLMEGALEKTRHHEVIRRVEDYLGATHASKGAIYFARAHEDIASTKDVIHFPVLLDGQPHTYRVFLNSQRDRGMERFASQSAVGGVRLVPALVDHVIADIESITFYQDAPLGEGNRIAFRETRLDRWSPLGHLDVLTNGLTHSPGKLASLHAPVDITEPGRISHIEVRMTLQRPVDQGFVDMLEVAYRNTLQSEAGLALARRLMPYDRLDTVAARPRASQQAGYASRWNEAKTQNLAAGPP